MTRRLQLLLIALSLPVHVCRATAPQLPLEYQVKAVCVLNAARFVTWPPTSFRDAAAPFVIGILGENPFGTLLDDAVKGETIRNRKIVVRGVTLAEAVTGCQILFISRSERDRLPAVIQALGTASVLTVSEIEGFTRTGGMLGLALDHAKIRFELNPASAHLARLKIDSQFLMLCRVNP
ncbi:MAG: hypothetical protein JWO94_2658 [Verrucomicrobiaceae bacterium]|nr:hypothetical protein [Verrucomicrobiaceae bacterium]